MTPEKEEARIRRFTHIYLYYLSECEQTDICSAVSELCRQARAEALEEAAKCLPDTWLDPLLTGPSATIPHDCPSTERFVRALQARIRALKEQPPEGERWR